ncbi:MAG TPA: carbohydrate kinase family protein [Candidatus Limivivens merdigallinarum]|uniref:Carbohydrate kinase family protein n=1 Tax=Candidatus Limivivens merdigallinarum TaxID=2840859 RepID=A0A9D1D157_9FIRM|nr:carbohydrate kinase family protein [Candidatus Limivivens merdigallinarum]
MSKKKAIAAGHICLDITPAFKSKEEKDITEIFVPGQLIAMEQAKVSIGGSVSNTGLGMKLLGADVELMGMVGKDAFGQMILSELERYGADSKTMIVREDIGTSYTVILAPAGIDRIMFHCSGANDEFVLDHIDLDRVKQANLFHFGYPSLMRNMYIDGGKELCRLLKAVHELGVAVSLDMAMFEESTEAGAQDWDAIVRTIMPYIDFFVPSVEELCIMLNRDRYHEWKERAAGRDVTSILDIEKDVKPLADRLLSYGAKVVLIKCGTPGLYFRTADKDTLKAIGGGIGAEIADTWAGKEAFEKSYLVEHVASGTGAGDTTIAAFLAAILEGRDWQDALHLATATGALCVQTYDALGGIIPLSEVQKKIDAGWQKRP